MGYGRFSTTDPSEFELALRPWDLLLDSSGRKDQRFEIEYFNLPGLTVSREHYTNDVRLVGMPPPNQLILAIPVGCNGESSFCGIRTIEHQLYSLSGDALDVRYRRGQTILCVQLDLSQEIAPSLIPSVEKLATNGRSFGIAQSVKDVTHLVRTIKQLLGLNSGKSVELHPARGQSSREAVVEALSRVVFPDEQDVIFGSKSSQKAAVSTALEYLRTPGVECASVSGLCVGAGVSERTLERGVRAQFDCTVVQLLRKWRLHAARRRLLVSEPQETTVSGVAASLGFHDFGRFAAAYRRRFEEYPSATLAGPSKSIAPRLSGV